MEQPPEPHGLARVAKRRTMHLQRPPPFRNLFSFTLPAQQTKPRRRSSRLRRVADPSTLFRSRPRSLSPKNKTIICEARGLTSRDVGMRLIRLQEHGLARLQLDDVEHKAAEHADVGWVLLFEFDDEWDERAFKRGAGRRGGGGGVGGVARDEPAECVGDVAVRGGHERAKDTAQGGFLRWCRRRRRGVHGRFTGGTVDEVLRGITVGGRHAGVDRLRKLPERLVADQSAHLGHRREQQEQQGERKEAAEAAEGSKCDGHFRLVVVVWPGDEQQRVGGAEVGDSECVLSGGRGDARTGKDVDGAVWRVTR